jgi:SHS2 domain-containing protein
MPFEVLEHTSDFRIKASGRNLAELFAAALAGLSSFLKRDCAALKPSVKRQVSLPAGDLTSLLIDFLNEALRLSATNKEIYNEVVFSLLSEQGLKAELLGAKVGDFDDEIKAVTYHQADVKKNADGTWGSEIIFDL